MHILFVVKEIDNEPQGILLISSLLKQAGHQVSLYGGQAHRFRRRSVDNVLRELKEVTSGHDVRFVLFMDDTFILQDKWLREFMPRY